MQASDVRFNLRSARRQKKYSTYRMAKELKVAQSSYLALERGPVEVTAVKAAHLAHVLGVNPGLFGHPMTEDEQKDLRCERFTAAKMKAKPAYTRPLFCRRCDAQKDLLRFLWRAQSRMPGGPDDRAHHYHRLTCTRCHYAFWSRHKDARELPYATAAEARLAVETGTKHRNARKAAKAEAAREKMLARVFPAA